MFIDLKIASEIRTKFIIQGFLHNFATFFLHSALNSTNLFFATNNFLCSFAFSSVEDVLVSYTRAQEQWPSQKSLKQPRHTDMIAFLPTNLTCHLLSCTPFRNSDSYSEKGPRDFQGSNIQLYYLSLCSSSRCRWSYFQFFLMCQTALSLSCLFWDLISIHCSRNVKMWKWAQTNYV